MLSIVFQAFFKEIKIVVKSFKQILTYFYPERYIKYANENFSEDAPIEIHMKNLLKVYILFGCDANPGRDIHRGWEVNFSLITADFIHFSRQVLIYLVW